MVLYLTSRNMFSLLWKSVFAGFGSSREVDAVVFDFRVVLALWTTWSGSFFSAAIFTYKFITASYIILVYYGNEFVSWWFSE